MHPIFDRLVEFWNSGNLDLIPQIFSEEYQRTDPDHGEPMRGRQLMAAYVAEVRTGFPDFRIEVNQQIGAADEFATGWTCTGTHTGIYQGIPPTGRKVNVSGVSLNRIQDGKIVEERTYFDRLGLLQQLGVIPDTQSESKSAGSH